MRDSWPEQGETKKEQGGRPFTLLALMLLNISAVELCIMHLFAPLFARVGWVWAGLLDAAIMTVVCAAPMWLLVARFPSSAAAIRGWNPAHRLLLAQALCGIFLIEFLAMLLVPVLLPDVNPAGRGLADAVITALLSAGPLWWLLFRYRKGAPAATLDTLDTPLRLFALLLGSVFLVNLLQEVLFPPHTFDLSPGSVKVLDACITALLSAPLLWILVARPLKKAAQSDRSRVSALYAQVVDAIVVMDRDGIIASCNPAAERMFGFTSGELHGRSVSFLLQGGRQGLEQLLVGAAALGASTGSVLSSELVCRGRDGALLIMDVSLSELLHEGGKEYLLIMRDITGRKRMEEAVRESETRFRQIFEQSEDAILFFRFGSCQILEVNGRAREIFGYDGTELVQGGLGLICPGSDFAAVSRDIAGMAESRPVLWEKVAGRRKDGSELLFSLRCKVMVLHGAPVTCCTLHDITERVRMEERAHEIQTKLIQANKMTSLGLLVSGVAHEINNPNNYVTVSARLFERIWQDALALIREYHEENGDFSLGGVPYARLEEHCRELLEGIVDGSRRIDEIVGNLKRFARQELATAEEVDLNAVAVSAVSLMRHELIKFTNRFEMELAPDPAPVRGSRQQLGQVVINLLMNACQALPGKESGIRLATAFDLRRREMTITVSDEGCGISEAESRRIMEPFFTTRWEEGGTGLGLAICDSIIREHHGTLGFVSEPGRGTTFTVTLPAGEDPATAEHGQDGKG